MRTNRSWIIEIDNNNINTVTQILEQPIMQVIKKLALLKQMEVEGNTYSLDFIADRLTAAHINQLLNAGVVVDRIKFFIELNPALANVNTPEMFPGREIAEVIDEGGTVITPSRILKVSEYFWNQIIDGRFFIRLAKAPIDANLNVDSDDLPNSAQVKQFITDHSTNILNYYSQMEYNELVTSLNETE